MTEAFQHRRADDRKAGGPLPSCESRVCPNIERDNATMSISVIRYMMRISSCETATEFRCQFPAAPVLAAQIRLPAGPQKLAQAVDIAGFCIPSGGFWVAKKWIFPASREKQEAAVTSLMTIQGRLALAGGTRSAGTTAKVAHISRI
jgi:hypothetical protein